MKTNRFLVFGAVLFAAVITSNYVVAESARTTSSNTGDYLSFLIIGGHSEVSDSKTSSGILQVRNDFDQVGAVGVAIGYNWAKKGLPIRSEIEYHYRARFDFDTRVANSAGYENQLSTHSLMVNAYGDYQLSDRWALFAGGGVGWAQNVSDVDRVTLIQGPKSELVTRTNNFAWNLALGAIWSFAESWDAEFRYRYIDLGEVKSGPHIDGTTITGGSYTSHDFILGITYRF